MNTSNITANNENAELNRLFWHSRRGMLELDCLLVPFIQSGYGNVDDNLKSLYKELLTCEDQDLFGWFMNPASTPEHFVPIVQHILEHNQNAKH